jgi:hypothetical protein
VDTVYLPLSILERGKQTRAYIEDGDVHGPSGLWFLVFGICYRIERAT